MGKIVKRAHVASESYRVSVPQQNGVGHAAETPAREQDPMPVAATGVPPLYEDAFDAAERSRTIEQKIDFETLRMDAEAIVERAALDAESLIKQAESMSLELIESAQTKIAQLEEEARDSGRESGFTQGHEAANAELQPVITTMRQMLEGIREQREAVIIAAEPELVRLAVAIAERIMHLEISTNPNVVVENVRSALTRLVSREVVTLRVNPVDHDAIRQYRDSIVAASDVEHLRIIEDQRVDRGGVLVETDAGTIDSKIATQLREAKRAILSEEQIALGDIELLQPSAQAS
jgi:flagellar assembly protein FliH